MVQMSVEIGDSANVVVEDVHMPRVVAVAVTSRRTADTEEKTSDDSPRSQKGNGLRERDREREYLLHRQSWNREKRVQTTLAAVLVVFFIAYNCLVLLAEHKYRMEARINHPCVIPLSERQYERLVETRSGNEPHSTGASTLSLVSEGSDNDDSDKNKTAVGPTDRVLVVYAFREEDEADEASLEFFALTGLVETSNVDVAIVFNGRTRLANLMAWPANVQVYVRDDSCGVLGAWSYGLAQATTLASGHSGPREYDYYLFLDGARVRGPFMPSHTAALVAHDWTKMFTSRLAEGSSSVLVGSTLSCARGYPHVKAEAWATNRQGLRILTDNDFFSCYEHFSRQNELKLMDLVELRLSQLILDAGFNIESFLPSTQGVDFRQEMNWKCNDMADPYATGITRGGRHLHPYDVLFYDSRRGSKDLYQRLTAVHSKEWRQSKMRLRSRDVTSQAGQIEVSEDAALQAVVVKWQPVAPERLPVPSHAAAAIGAGSGSQSSGNKTTVGRLLEVFGPLDQALFRTLFPMSSDVVSDRFRRLDLIALGEREETKCAKAFNGVIVA